MSVENFIITKHLIPTQHIREYPRSLAREEEDALQIAVKQYTPRDNLNPQPGDVTLIAAHANGVSKELYEPLWDELYLRSQEREREGKNGFRIRNIWIADVAWQGESGVLNEEKLGNDPSWYDHPRDLLHMINHFRSEIKLPIFGVGHSMGGNNLTTLSFFHPRLLSGLILIDPVIQENPISPNNFGPAQASAFRRDYWPSREAATKSLQKNPFFGGWDNRCLERHIQFGFRDLPTPIYPASNNSVSNLQAETPVTLTTTKHQEVFSFLRPLFPPSNSDEDLKTFVPNRKTHPDVMKNEKGQWPIPFYRPEQVITYHLLPMLRPRVLYIWPEKSYICVPPARKSKMEITGTGLGGSGGKDVNNAVQEVAIADLGHFAPFEKPDIVARSIEEWLAKELERWRNDKEEQRAEWEETQKRDGGRGRITMSKEYLDWIKPVQSGEKNPSKL